LAWASHQGLTFSVFRVIDEANFSDLADPIDPYRLRLLGMHKTVAKTVPKTVRPVASLHVLVAI
jgi:hypothetical protein